MKGLSFISILIVSFMMISCASSKNDAAPDSKEATLAKSRLTESTNSSYYIPNAVAYQTNGDYNDHIFVNLNAEHTAIINYPAITDVTVNSAPIDLGDGWLLDRRGGIGLNSAFLTYTYKEYSSLKDQPSPKELYSKIIDGAKVTRCISLPVNINKAIADPESVKQYLPKE